MLLLLDDRRKRKPFVYRLKDNFVTAQGAPIPSPRTCEPGPGSLPFVQTAGSTSIAGDKLVIGGAAAGTWGQHGYYSTTGVTRAAGEILACQMNLSTWNNAALQWRIAAGINTPATAEHAAVIDSTSGFLTLKNSTVIRTGLTTGTDYVFASVLRSAGSFILGREGTTWSHYFPVNVGATATLYPVFNRLSAVMTQDYIKQASLPANGYSAWSTDAALQQFNVALPVAGNTQTGLADLIIDITWVPVAGETLDIMVRRTDDTATWSIVCAESTAVNPDTIKLIERNAGNIERSSVAQVFAAGSTYRILGRFAGNMARTWVDIAGTATAKNIYNSASFNNTVTGCKVSGTTGGLSNWICWYYTLPPILSVALDRFIVG